MSCIIIHSFPFSKRCSGALKPSVSSNFAPHLIVQFLFQVLDLLCVLLSRPQLIQLEVLEVKGLQHECSNGNHHLPEFGSGYVRLLMGRMSILKVSDGYAGMRKMRYANILNCDWHLLAGPFHCIETKHVHFLDAWLTKLSQVILSHFRNKSSK